jgi:hypothetical protein
MIAITATILLDNCMYNRHTLRVGRMTWARPWRRHTRCYTLPGDGCVGCGANIHRFTEYKEGLYRAIIVLVDTNSG